MTAELLEDGRSFLQQTASLLQPECAREVLVGEDDRHCLFVADVLFAVSVHSLPFALSDGRSTLDETEQLLGLHWVCPVHYAQTGLVQQQLCRGGHTDGQTRTVSTVTLTTQHGTHCVYAAKTCVDEIHE